MFNAIDCKNENFYEIWNLFKEKNLNQLMMKSSEILLFCFLSFLILSLYGGNRTITNRLKGLPKNNSNTPKSNTLTPKNSILQIVKNKLQQALTSIKLEKYFDDSHPMTLTFSA